MKNHLAVTFKNTRAENRSTGCTSILRRFCKMKIKEKDERKITTFYYYILILKKIKLSVLVGV